MLQSLWNLVKCTWFHKLMLNNNNKNDQKCTNYYSEMYSQYKCLVILDLHSQQNFPIYSCVYLSRCILEKARTFKNLTLLYILKFNILSGRCKIELKTALGALLVKKTTENTSRDLQKYFSMQDMWTWSFLVLYCKRSTVKTLQVSRGLHFLVSFPQILAEWRNI